MTHYRYAMLMPKDSTVSEQHNAQFLGPTTLGIEVTEPALAARCGLGNIDPQHDGSGSSLAAIEAALDFPLPPDGATLVTIRPDMDSLGAMALLTTRAHGIKIDDEMRARIGEIAAIDGFQHGSWPGPRPWPVAPDDLFEDVGGGTTGALAAAVRDRTQPIGERVGVMRAWLERGSVPESYVDAAQQRVRELWRALKNGEVRISEKAAPGQVAEIQSAQGGALFLGYRLAPVVVAYNPHFEFSGGVSGPKYTIAQFSEGYVDLAAVIAGLNEREPSWGGSKTIAGSPQGHPSKLSRDEVVSAVVGNIVKERGSWPSARKAS